MVAREYPNGVVCFVSPQLEAIGVPHGFSTRIGGVSGGPFASLNLGNPMGSAERDPDSNVVQNYALLMEAIGLKGKELSRVHQVHGREIVILRGGDLPARHQQADALMTDSPDLPVSVRTADCVPILVADSRGRWVAAVHAGWRGIVSGILPATITGMAQHGIAPDQLIVAIGPCIGPAVFEVGEEVADEFRRVFADEAPITQNPGEKPHIDLCAAATLQALRCGVSRSHVDPANLCTLQHPEWFFSHRRDQGLTGRMAAVIAPAGSSR